MVISKDVFDTRQAKDIVGDSLAFEIKVKETLYIVSGKDARAIVKMAIEWAVEREINPQFWSSVIAECNLETAMRELIGLPVGE